MIRAIAIGGHTKMTKTYLKNIIREELEALLKEVAKSKSQKRFMLQLRDAKKMVFALQKKSKKQQILCPIKQ